MEQSRLRELEARCIQEERAYCIAACPIHVDVRSMMSAVSKGDIKGARKVLDRTMPFPEILGRICDQPCLESCIRNKAGGSLCIGAVERFCIENSREVLKPPKLPPKEGRVAIIGSGYSAMTAALDLARKGRPGAMFITEERLGGPLNNLPEDRMPADVLIRAKESLEGIGVRIESGKEIDAAGFEEIVAGYDALYIELAFDGIEDFGLKLEEIDPTTLQVGEKIFAGGQARGEKYSAMTQAASGRRAASSIDRFLQGASLTSMREKEGPFNTRLYTYTGNVEKVEPVQPAGTVYSEEEVKVEASRCLLCECMQCVKSCDYLQQYKGYPKRYAREIYNNQAIVQGTRKANKMINSCSLCGQCEEICPNDFSMASLCLDARRHMVEQNHMPPSAHDFALLDMEFSRGENFAVLKHEPGKTESSYLFFPGCQLCGSCPDTVEKLYAHLRGHLSGGTGLMLDCCGIPAQWAGREADYSEIKKSFVDKVKAMGSPTLITACATCHDSFTRELSELEIRSVWEVLDAEGLPEISANLPRQAMSISDPCTARHNVRIQDAVRNVAGKMGFKLEEPSHAKNLADCCGFGGLMFNANPELAEKSAETKGNRSTNDILAYCAMCRDNIAASGKRAAHLLEYIFPAGQSKTSEELDADAPLARPNPGFSMRQENRARLKSRLLESVWREKSVTMPEYSAIKLHISDELRPLLEKRRVLDQDIQKTIMACENSGKKLCNSSDGFYLASYRPVRVTYWVEYRPVGDGYEIRNAYSHRMILPGDEDE